MFLSFYKKSEPKIATTLCTPVCLGHPPLSLRHELYLSGYYVSPPADIVVMHPL